MKDGEYHQKNTQDRFKRVSRLIRRFFRFLFGRARRNGGNNDSRRKNRYGFHQEFRVYDREGELLASISLQLKNDAESESVNIVNGFVYVTSSAGRRAYLYRVDFNTKQ